MSIKERLPAQGVPVALQINRRIYRFMTHGVRPNLSNNNEHHHVNETRERVHVPTDHDRLTQERYNARIDLLRTTGRITVFEADWYKHHYVVDEGWMAPDEA